MSITRRNTRLGAQPITQPITRGITLPITGESGVAGYTHETNGYSWCGTYTGTGASLAITGLGFQPDFIIIAGNTGAGVPKFYSRSLAAFGAGKYQRLIGAAIATDAQSVTSFDADGFTLGTSAASNDVGQVFVFMAWKAVAAFSAQITYAGTGSAKTEAHGLGATPNFIAVKDSSTRDWGLYHSALTSPGTKGFSYNAPLVVVSAGFWNNTAPDGTNITVGNGTQTNENTKTYNGFTMANVAGVFKVGTYTGNGSPSGPVVTGLGFSPRGVLFFRTASSSGPSVFALSDLEESLTGVRAQSLISIVNTQDNAVNFDADGFTITTDVAIVNNIGTQYLYLAFAA